MTGSDLVKMYEFTYMALKRNLDGISHDESLVSPQPSGNCINWVLGHVVLTRGFLLKLAGIGDGAANEQLSRYGRGSEPVHDGEKTLDLGTLRGLLEDSQQKLIAALAAMPDEALAAPIPEQFRRPPLTGSIGDALARLNAHESYHGGQIGLLRRLIGKQGAIR